MQKTIYFLCTGNSCRSQMAEGFGKKYLPDWRVLSAGLEAHGLNPNAVKAMAEAGIDITGHTSDTIDPAVLQQATMVVTLCGHADEHCPVTPPTVRREHWGFDDPAKATGTEEEKWAVFTAVRDAIEERIRQFAKEEAEHGHDSRR